MSAGRHSGPARLIFGTVWDTRQGAPVFGAEELDQEQAATVGAPPSIAAYRRAVASDMLPISGEATAYGVVADLIFD